MANLGISDFKAKIKGGGARPNLFRATLNFPGFAQGDVELSSFLCKAAQLPGSTYPEIIVPFRGRQMKIAGDRVFENWTVTILNDTDFSLRNAFERWMAAVNGHATNEGLVNPTDYMVDLSIDQLDKDDSILKTYNFRDAFPVNVSPIDVAYDANDQIEEFTVEFAFQYWESLGITN